jgi:TRAP transporter TAXI family solute receptor
MGKLMRRLRKISLHDLLAVVLPAAVLVIAAFWVAAQFIRPAPPDRLVITTGSDGGAYQHFAARYKPILERYGIRLVEKVSAGSAENLKRLLDDKEEVDLGFIQGGSGVVREDTTLVSLGSLYYEPLWVFYRGAPGLTRLDQLAGKRLAIGAEGSGTNQLVRDLLDAHGLNGDKVTLAPLSGLAAVEALEQGEVDAVCVVGAPLSAAIWLLLHTPGVALLSFEQADAYTRRFPYLSRLTLPHGVINFERDIPPRDIVLVSPVATLVARQDTHPALIDIMLQAMVEVHREPGIFQKANEFPSGKQVDFPLSPRAERFYKSGPPLLQRYLPFWVANFVDRVIVMLVPIVAILFPLMRITPPLYSWRVRSRIYRWYGELKFLEYEAEHDSRSRTPQEWNAALDRIEQAVNRIPTPLAYADQLYTLRSHIALVRQELGRRIGGLEPAQPSAQG